MKKYLLGALVAVSVVGVAASEAWAFRGPRGGGGSLGGGKIGGGLGGSLGGGGLGGNLGGGQHGLGSSGIKPPAGGLNHGPQNPGLKPSGTQSGPKNIHDVNGANKVGNHTVYGWAQGHAKPFTPAWYLNHPNAWRFTHPYAGVVAAATLATWLAVPTVPVSSGYATADGYATTAPSQEQAAAATNLAIAGGGDVPAGAEWMELGTFALRPTGDARASRVVQLGVGHDGKLRGSSYDLLSDDVQTIYGAVDKQSLRAAWRIGSRGQVVFQVPVGELTKAEAEVTAFFPDGSSAPWRLTRLGQ